PDTPVASRGKKGIALVPLGGTKLNWASSTAASVFQSLRAVLILNRAGVSVSVTTYLRGNGRLPSAIQIWKSTPGRLNSRGSHLPPPTTVLPTTAASVTSCISSGKTFR